MNELNKRKKEFLKAYNNLCSCYGDIISEQTKVSCNILAEKVKLQQQLAIAVKSLSTITNCAPACFRTEECPLEGGCEFNNGCFRCGYATAFEALQKIKELGK